MKNVKIACIGDSLTRGYGVSERDCWVSSIWASTAKAPEKSSKGSKGPSRPASLSGPSFYAA